MKRVLSATAGLIASLALVALVASGCATTRTAGEQVDDAAITSKVKSKLAADPEVNPFEIDVDTREGVVRLSGVVDDEQERQEAERLAQNTEGVRRVVNDLQIGGTEVGRGLSDASITSKVKAKLASDPEVDSVDIDVDTIGGVVTLSGLVKSDEQREEAEALARNTEGVREVRNRLEVQEGMDF